MVIPHIVPPSLYSNTQYWNVLDYFADFSRLLRTMQQPAQMKDVWKTQLMVEHIQHRVLGVEVTAPI